MTAGHDEPIADLTDAPRAQDFLDRISEHILEQGLADSSLRRLASIAGTSHQLLLYYFGSRDGLLGSVMYRLRQAESRELFGRARSRREAIARAWDYYTAEARQAEMRIFFYLAGQALQDDGGATDFTAEVVNTWTEALTELGVREGLSRREASTDARFLVAALRGLLMDFLLTRDNSATRRAFTRLVRLVEGSATER
jgi:AcrR family transcriptional regulator